MNLSSGLWFWVLWGVVLLWQNYAFTRVSRARNSASLKAHALAALQSNGVWFVQSCFLFTQFMSILTGKAGIIKAIGAALYYAVFTMAGSIYAHYVSLKKEKGATAVGANAKYAQIPVEEWAALKEQITQQKSALAGAVDIITQAQSDLSKLPSQEDFQKVRDLAYQAYDITVGMIPDAGIKAQKFDGATVVTGMTMPKVG